MKSNVDPKWIPRFCLIEPPVDLFSTAVMIEREKITSK